MVRTVTRKPGRSYRTTDVSGLPAHYDPLITSPTPYFIASIEKPVIPIGAEWRIMTANPSNSVAVTAFSALSKRVRQTAKPKEVCWRPEPACSSSLTPSHVSVDCARAGIGPDHRLCDGNRVRRDDNCNWCTRQPHTALPCLSAHMAYAPLHCHEKRLRYPPTL